MPRDISEHRYIQNADGATWWTARTRFVSHRCTGRATERFGTQDSARTIYLSIYFHENIRTCAKHIKVPGCSESLSLSGSRRIHRSQSCHPHHGLHGLEVHPSQQHFARLSGSGSSILTGRGFRCSRPRRTPVTTHQSCRVAW